MEEDRKKCLELLAKVRSEIVETLILDPLCEHSHQLGQINYYLEQENVKINNTLGYYTSRLPNILNRISANLKQINHKEGTPFLDSAFVILQRLRFIISELGDRQF